MVNLPAIGTIRYNGYTFGAATETENISGKARWDSAGRTISYMTYTVSIRTIIAESAPTTTDATIASLRQTLMAPGKEFTYEDKGFGDLTVNVGAVRDVAWGPKPQSFTWKPFSGRHAVEVKWVVEVSIPECDNAKFRGVTEANFGVSFARDKYGLTKRTFRGELHIASVRNGRRVVETADDYLGKFIPSVPKHFVRVSQDEEVSMDKTKLTITVVDEEHKNDNVPPEGIVEASIEHDISCRGGGDDAKSFFTKHIGRITGNYVVARGFKMNIAVQNFAAVIQDRVFRLIKDLKKDSDAKPGELTSVLPLTSSITETDAYGLQRVKCSMSYLMVGPPSIFMTKSLFRKMPGSNDDLWAKSMAKTWDARGWAGLKLDATDDAIIDLCQGGDINILKKKANPVNNAGLQGQGAEKIQGWTWPWPDRDKSIVDMQMSLTLEPEDHVLRHVPLESGESRLRTPALLSADPLMRMAAVPKGSDPPIFQARAATMPTVIFSGSIIRAGWEIEAPVLRSAFGRVTIPANEEGYGFKQERYPFSGPVPIFIATWMLRYYLSDRPVQLFGENAQGGVQPQQPNNLPQPNVQFPMPFNAGGGWAAGQNQGGNQAWANLFGTNGINLVSGNAGELQLH